MNLERYQGPLLITLSFIFFKKRETFFMNRRFETLPLDDQNLKIPIQNVSEILEIVGAPTLDVALYNLDQLTSSKQINTGNNQISSLLEQGIIRHLINLLNNPNIDELFKKITVRILGNIASGPQAICKSVVEAGGIPLFVNYLNESIEKEDVQLMEMVILLNLFFFQKLISSY